MTEHGSTSVPSVPAVSGGRLPLEMFDIWRGVHRATLRDEMRLKGLDAMWHGMTGQTARIVPRRRRLLDLAHRLADDAERMRKMSDHVLREQMQMLRERVRCGRVDPAVQNDAVLCIREAATRTLGQTPYPVQMAAGLALMQDTIIELATGEGKTLAAVFPAILAGWRGRGCHVLTTNDYLAGRDAATLSPLYAYCHVSVGVIRHELPPHERRAAYRADVTYGTNKEMAADCLRDRLAMGRQRHVASALLDRFAMGRGARLDRVVMRGLDTAIVDEADSILIDEAVTPLIISGQGRNADRTETYRIAQELVSAFAPGVHYTRDERHREVRLTPAGRALLAENTAPIGGVFAGRRRAEELALQAITARELFLEGTQYVVQDGKIVIVDEFTGRLMPDRTWREGLHQSIEAKEGLEIQAAQETYSRLSFQRFFLRYRHLAGMTGTAAESWREFWRTYGIPTVVLPTHRPCRRQDDPDRYFATAAEKWDAIDEEIMRVHATGRPILVGTRSVEASEQLSRRLLARGVTPQVLNAVRHAEEASIVARAGEHGRITVATNMAGRGTDI
ncbi:MAG: hypothetical protein KC983_04795, partial [Phycisphaerales bacterium]|nr:hypothetical protein [Phycisphaerales bacterium]